MIRSLAAGVAASAEAGDIAAARTAARTLLELLDGPAAGEGAEVVSLAERRGEEGTKR